MFIKDCIFWVCHFLAEVNFHLLTDQGISLESRRFKHFKNAFTDSESSLLSFIFLIFDIIFPLRFKSSESKSLQLWDALRNLAPFVRFKKCEKHPWVFFTFLNRTNGIKLRNASHIVCFLLKHSTFQKNYFSLSQSNDLFYPPWEHLKTRNFLMDAGGMKKECLPELS